MTTEIYPVQLNNKIKRELGAVKHGDYEFVVHDYFFKIFIALTSKYTMCFSEEDCSLRSQLVYQPKSRNLKQADYRRNMIVLMTQLKGKHFKNNGKSTADVCKEHSDLRLYLVFCF